MPNETISVEFKNEVAVVQVLERRIFLKVTAKFREEFIPLIEEGQDKIVVDLGKVSVMNSAGLGVLILAHDILSKRNGRMIISDLQPLMKEIFTRMKLDTLLEVRETTDAALEAFKASAG